MGMEGMFDAPFKALLLCFGSVICIVIAGVALVIFAMYFDSKNKGEEKVLNNYGEVMTIEACGETHQYLFADRGICHLPNCKYCQKVSNQK